MSKTEILRSLNRLISEWGLEDTDDDAVVVSPVDQYGEYCGWNVADALLIEFEDSGRNYVIRVDDE